MQQGGTIGSASQGLQGGACHAGRECCCAAHGVHRELERTASFCALAVGAISLAIGTASVARVTYDQAPATYGRAAAEGDLLLATSLTTPLPLYARPTAAAAPGGTPVMFHFATPAPQLNKSAGEPAGRPAEAGFGSVAVHGNPPPSGVPYREAATLPTDLPRVHRCNPVGAMPEADGVTCPRFVLAAAPTVAAGEHNSLAAAQAASAPPAADGRYPEPNTQGVGADAIARAEAVVETVPLHPGNRYDLGAAYLKAGRFASAASAFEDAIALGDRQDLTVLALAMSLAASGRAEEAVRVLTDSRGRIDKADLGITLALVGHPSQGSKLIEEAILAGASNSGTRQDLAFAYTLAGRWREARALAEVDLEPSLAHQRIAQWLETSAPQAAARRIANYLRVAPPQVDPGQPQHLALRPALPVAIGAIAAASPELSTQPAMREAGAHDAEGNDLAPARPGAVIGLASAAPLQEVATPASETLVAGEVAIHLTGSAVEAVRIADLLDLVAGRMDADLHATLSASPHAQALVRLDALDAHGIAFSRAADGTRLSLTMPDL